MKRGRKEEDGSLSLGKTGVKPCADGEKEVAARQKGESAKGGIERG